MEKHPQQLRGDKEGYQVGNGRRIHISEDKGLPTPTTYKVISPPNDLGDFPMVSSLINEDTKWWKVHTIKDLFLPFEASSILKIPLSYNLPKDKLIWVGNKRGYFTVKKAYYIDAKIVDSRREKAQIRIQGLNSRN